jgi:hypothetical protein
MCICSRVPDHTPIDPRIPESVALQNMLHCEAVWRVKANTAMLIQDTSAPQDPWETIVTYCCTPGALNHVSAAVFLRM